ncbi:MAG TPA: GNAT family N-acetyltransferase [Gaiellaceae bacterium]|nr:GNAT family N-acetyltransferase [Gaiellaceae bacterium]
MIRRARPEDAEAVVRSFRESRAEAMPWLPVVHTAEEEIAFFRRALAGEAFVYEVDGAPAGFAILRDDELTALYVAPESQREGVGWALFRCAQEARPGGFSFWVFRDNTRARRFYESHGAQLLYETDGAANEERTPDARYEWRPTPAAAGA